MASNVNIYSYTAAANPYFAKSLAHKYGYVAEPNQPLGQVLQQLVAFEGEPALTEIIENNPDKELFMEYFEKKYGKANPNCTCGQKKEESALANFMNFSGAVQAQQQAANQKITTETSMIVLAGAVLIAMAIFMSKN